MRLPRHKNKRHKKNKTTKKSAELADFYLFFRQYSLPFHKKRRCLVGCFGTY